MNNNFRFETNFNNPILYDVIFLNDPITTMEFVQRVLRNILTKNIKMLLNLLEKFMKKDMELLVHIFMKLQDRKNWKQV